MKNTSVLKISNKAHIHHLEEFITKLDGPRSTARPSMPRPMVRLRYLYRPTCTNHPQVTLGLQWYVIRPKKYIFFPMMTPIDIKPSPFVTQVQYGSVCKISPLYIMLMMTRNYSVDMNNFSTNSSIHHREESQQTYSDNYSRQCHEE